MKFSVTDDLAAAAPVADEEDETTETTTEESMIRKTTTTTTTTSYTSNEYDNRQESNVVINEIQASDEEKSDSEEELSPKRVEPHVEVTSEESSNVTETDDGYQVHTQTRKTTVTTTMVSESEIPLEHEMLHSGKQSLKISY